MKHIIMRLLAVIVGVAVFSTTALSSAEASTTSAQATAAHRATSTAAAAPAGTIHGHVKGVTRAGGKLVGRFTPDHFVKRPHRVMAKGTLVGTLTRANGHEVQINRQVAMRVTKANFIGQRTGSAAASDSMAADAAAPGTCQILDLVLGPLDLNLLGVVIHLDRVHLNITAHTGPGNLLGNLLCGLAGLLNGVPLAGLLGRLTAILNRLLAALG
jgi:hypothetical protein